MPIPAQGAHVYVGDTCVQACIIICQLLTAGGLPRSDLVCYVCCFWTRGLSELCKQLGMGHIVTSLSNIRNDLTMIRLHGVKSSVGPAARK